MLYNLINQRFDKNTINSNHQYMNISVEYLRNIVKIVLCLVNYKIFKINKN